MAPPTSNKYWDDLFKKSSFPVIVGKFITWNDPHDNPFKTCGKLMPLSINGVDVRKILTAQEYKSLRPLWCHYYQFTKPGSERLRAILKENKNVIVSGEGIGQPEPAFVGEDIDYKSYVLYYIEEYNGPITKTPVNGLITNTPVNRMITNSRIVRENTSFAAALTMAPPSTPVSSPIVEVNETETPVSAPIVEVNETENQETFSEDDSKQAIIQSLKQQITEIKHNHDMAISDLDAIIMQKDIQLNEMDIEMKTMKTILTTTHEKSSALETENIEIHRLNCEMEEKLTALDAEKETFVHLLEDEKHKLMAMENKYQLEITNKIAEAEHILTMTKDLEKRITLPDKVEGAAKFDNTETKFSHELFHEDEWEIITTYGYNDLKRIIRNISVIGQDKVVKQMMQVIPHPTVCLLIEQALQNK